VVASDHAERLVDLDKWDRRSKHQQSGSSLDEETASEIKYFELSIL
jgi:hypothetical protein